MTTHLLNNIGLVLGSIVSTLTVANFIFYTKSQVQDKLKEQEKEFDEQQNALKGKLDALNKDIQEKVQQTRQSFESGVKEFIDILTEIKEGDKENTVQFINLINTIKDELRHDYTSKYNELLVLVNSKVSQADFSRLEDKFDKVSEIIIELKTTIELQSGRDK